MKNFRAENGKFHFYWSRDLEPVAEIEPGETITVETRDSSDGQIGINSTASDIMKIDFSRVNPSTGPFSVKGAEKGDTLVVEILEIEDKGWGWTGIIPGFGLLAGESSASPSELNRPAIKIWKTESGISRARFGEMDVEIVNEPFVGTIGVAPEFRGIYSIVPPRENGGNMDNKLISKGSKLYLPVLVKNALFSLGDVHLAQGDGEVCGTAIEAPANVKIKISLIKATFQKLPYVTFGRRRENYSDYVAFSGFSNNVIDAARMAVLRMVNTFSQYMDPSEAYMLASVALDLRISEIVDMPNYHVTGVIPLDIVKDEGLREKIRRSVI